MYYIFLKHNLFYDMYISYLSNKKIKKLTLKETIIGKKITNMLQMTTFV